MAKCLSTFSAISLQFENLDHTSNDHNKQYDCNYIFLSARKYSYFKENMHEKARRSIDKFFSPSSPSLQQPPPRPPPPAMAKKTLLWSTTLKSSTTINLLEMFKKTIINHLANILLMLTILAPLENILITNKVCPTVLALDVNSRILSAHHETYHQSQHYYQNNNNHHHLKNHQQQIIKKAHFAEQDTSNVQRVPVGRPVKFKCVVNNIGDHKVAWFHKEKRLLLAFDNSTITWKERIQVSSHANSVFFLTIDSVQLSDKGQFSCQLNTQPAQSQSHILDVVKSPSINEEETTITIEPVKEFSSIELRCAADGIPKPTIKWRRESQMHVMPAITSDEEDVVVDNAADDVLASESGSNPTSGNIRGTSSDSVTDEHDDAASDSEGITNKKKLKKNRDDKESAEVQQPSKLPANRSTMSSSALPLATNNNNNNNTTMSNRGGNSVSVLAEGEVLRFERVSRYDMGFYICIASNDIPPSVSQRIFLPVKFVHQAAISSTTSSSSTTTTTTTSLIGATNEKTPQAPKQASAVTKARKTNSNSRSSTSPLRSGLKLYSSGNSKTLASSLNGNAGSSGNNGNSLKSGKGSTTNGIPSVDLFFCMFLIIIVYNNLMQPDVGALNY